MDWITRTARQIAKERLVPVAMEIDRNHTYPREQIRLLGDAGFCQVGIAEEKGGIGLGRECFAAVVREIAGACASTALVYVSHSAVVKAVATGGDGRVQKQWLPEMLKGAAIGAFAVNEPGSGSNAAAVATRAARDGDSYVVNGSKSFITSAGEADLYLVLVRTDPEKGPQGMSALIIEKDTPGLSFGKPEDKMGLSGTSSGEVFFTDCRIPADHLVGKEGEGLPVIAGALMGWGFFGAAGISAGIARSACAIAVKHARERTIAGQPLAAHQAVGAMIADMAVKTDAVDALLDSCARNADLESRNAFLFACKTKLFASETAVDVANTAIQVMGGHGYCRDYNVERLFRDARGLTIHFKTSQWLRQDIAQILTGV
ncbi:MAG: acyl-CoA dehydrogenase family protein [Peptococcaceae bacterium]|jgi:butyryl-CoA dehydrogenase|nr:acyl-CoA dehydrogenase family protein [Peptococcaceae bacterium]